MSAVAAEEPRDQLAGRLPLLTDAVTVLGPGLEPPSPGGPLLWEGDQA